MCSTIENSMVPRDARDRVQSISRTRRSTLIQIIGFSDFGTWYYGSWIVPYWFPIASASPVASAAGYRWLRCVSPSALC